MPKRNCLGAYGYGDDDNDDDADDDGDERMLVRMKMLELRMVKIRRMTTLMKARLRDPKDLLALNS